MTEAWVAVSSLAGLVLGGGGVWAYLAARTTAKPSLIRLSQEIAAQTIEALDSRMKEVEAKLTEQSEQIAALTAHISTLEQVILDLGRQPPPRPASKGARA